MDQIDFIQKRAEKMYEPYTKEQKINLLDKLMESTLFSQYCDIKFQSQKRFGGEGLDASVSAMMSMIE